MRRISLMGDECHIPDAGAGLILQVTLSDLWLMLAGLGIFLYGISQMEDALKQLAGRTFKIFLRKNTDNKISAILGGTLVTGVLQSSSAVSLMVLSLVGAGVISMRNGLAVVFGSNLGTTFSNWVVAALGFRFSIENLSLPIIALASAGLIAFSGRKKLHRISKLCMGFGLLFLGLGFMKESMDALVKSFDFAPYLGQGKIIFVLIGFAITAIIQSSSATMVITLSALNAGVIPFDIATSVIIGSELGTSIKILIGSLGGVAAKRRIALGNIIFNGVITITAYLMLNPLIHLIRNFIGVADPLIALVAFQSIINLSGIILFLPFLNYLGDFLEKRFGEKETLATYFIRDVNSIVPEAALEVLEKETLLFIRRVIRLNMEAFRLAGNVPFYVEHLKDIDKNGNRQFRSYIDRYDHLKRAEGEILSLYARMSEDKIEKEDFARVNQLISSVRNAMYSAKGIKDIHEDRRDLREAIDFKYEHYLFLQERLNDFYSQLGELLDTEDKSASFEVLVRLMGQIRTDYETSTDIIYKQSAKDTLEKLDIATLQNVNREVYSSCKALIQSLKYYLLDPVRSEDFDAIPVSIK